MSTQNPLPETNNSAKEATEKFADIVAAIREEYLSETQNYPWIAA